MKAGTWLALVGILSAPALAENNLRDPFVKLQPAAVTTAPLRPALSVTGLMESGDRYVAIILYENESRIVQVGDLVGDSRVLKISPDGVTLLSRGDDQQVRLGESDVKLSFEYAWVYEIR